MHQSFHVPIFQQRIRRPCVGGFGRIVGIECYAAANPAEHGLLDASNVLRRPEFRQFLEPQEFEISMVQFDGFRFRGIVRAAKHDPLTGFFQDDFIRRFAVREHFRPAQCIDCPNDLGVHRILDRIADAAVYDGVCIGIHQQSEDEHQRYERGFRGRATALQPIVGVFLIEDVLHDGVEGCGDQVIDLHRRLHRYRLLPRSAPFVR